FFSSRRRHTRSTRDWSSDVCSSDLLQSAAFGLAFGYAQPPSEVQANRLKELRTELDGYLAKFNDLLQTDVAAFNKTAAERQAPILVAGRPIEVKEVKIVSR